VDRTKAFAGLIAAALLGTACGGPRLVRVGSKTFTEKVILGEIVAAHLETRLHAPVERRLNLGGTMLAHEALRSGDIDVYPEYTGTALMAVLKQPGVKDPGAAFAQVESGYRQWGLVWLPPLGFNNSFAMIVRGDAARDGRLKTLSDAAARRQGWALGAGYEFMDRRDGFHALRDVYGLRLDGAPKTMDLGLLYQALTQNRVSMAAGNETDGMLSALDVRVLEDDRHAFPPYQAALVARAAAFGEHPGMREALAELSGKFNVETMRRLNHEVDGSHQAASAVARAFLRQAGLAR
jgi:osmoprotectant transport system substrate-binding protein